MRRKRLGYGVVPKFMTEADRLRLLERDAFVRGLIVGLMISACVGAILLLLNLIQSF